MTTPRSSQSIHEPLVGPMASSRREFLRNSALGVGATAMALSPFRAFAAGEITRTTGASGFGALVPLSDINTGLPLLQLPSGFSYVSFGFIGEPMSDGFRTPPSRSDS